MSTKLHPAQLKQKKTKKLFERTLDEIVVFGENDFSYPYIIKKMKTVASPEEQSEGIVITSTTTISHSKEYKSIIRQAKIKASEKKVKTIDWDTDLNLSEHEMKLRIDLLIRKNEQIKDELDYCKELLQRVDHELIDEKSEPITNLIPDKRDDVYKNILKNLIETLNDTGLMRIEKRSPQEPLSLWLYVLGGSKKIMGQDLMEDIGLKLTSDKLPAKTTK